MVVFNHFSRQILFSSTSHESPFFQSAFDPIKTVLHFQRLFTRLQNLEKLR